MEQIKNDIFSFKNHLTAFLLIGSFLVGLFNEPAGVLCSIVLTIFLILRWKEKEISLSLNFTTLAVALISFSFLIVALWAKDKYYALLGFCKFFPLLLFYLNISTTTDFDSEKALLFIPYSAALMTVISYIFSKIEATAYLFSVDGRIAGFFQYPNTFALFLILGIVVIAFQKHMHWLYYVLSAVMVFGIFMSGSRTSFVIFVLTVIALMFLSKNKTLKWILIGVSVMLVIAAVIIFLFSSTRGALGRFLSISVNSGTFNARILYAKDALKYVLKHPFGIGYMSYYFTQGSFQTGLYSNRFVHNELLQMMMDIGWIPAIAALACVVKAFLSKEKPLLMKFLLAIILVHSLLEFDFQFLTICFIALICIQQKSSPTVLHFKPATKKVLFGFVCFLCCLGIYFGASSAAFLLEKNEAAVKICPHNTMAQIERLNASNDALERKSIAQTILENNQYIANAYFALEDYYYREGKIKMFSDYALENLRCNRFNSEAYVAYASRLITAAKHFETAGDINRLKMCTSLLLSLEKTIVYTNKQADPLAKYLPENSTLGLSQQTRDEINRLNNEYLKAKK